jgi:hypothetical protein
MQGRENRVVAAAVALAAAALLVAAATAGSATPPGATLAPDANGAGRITWTGTASVGSALATGDAGESCFDANLQPDPGTGCDFFRLDVSVPADFWRRFPGTVDLLVTDFGVADLDMYVYERNADGTRGEFVGGAGFLPGVDEEVAIDKPEGAYYVVIVPYLVLGAQDYSGSAEFVTRQGPGIDELNRTAPPGVRNYRASRDSYISHSEPTIAMDPLDHDHLMAASKMYENNEDYLFKVGTYESFDGGRTWQDQGQLPGYCEEPGQCDPTDEELYRTTSDPSIAFDDEGNAYANVLDAPGGTFAFQGFNMTAHVKRPGQPWSSYTTVHDNRNNPITEALLLDDKNWIAVDNETDVTGAPNEPRDGKVGTIYICWSFDGTGIGPVPLPMQQIVVMRSTDGGRTWGGATPGDNLPYPVSQKTIVSGIGCHIAISPAGEVYITWYDNQLDLLMQAKSANRGRSWTPAYPIAGIFGVNEPFEGEAFRNLSIPTTGVDRQGNIYVAVASRNAEGNPIASGALELGRKLKDGSIDLRDLEATLRRRPANDINRKYLAGGDGEGPESGADIVLFKSSDGGDSWTGPVRVNQDPPNADADQFQPWLAVTEGGQVNVSFFDRRNDPENFFIDTYLARSNDGGATFTDTRVSQSLWDPSVNAPTSVSGKFIGDYQGLVADDEVAIPFWNDTQLNNLPTDHPEYSPYQEVFAARVPNSPARGGPAGRCFPRRVRVGARAIWRARVGATRATVRRRVGLPRRRRGSVWTYCVRGGGKVVLVFDRRGRARFIVSTARRHRRLGVGRGSSVRRLRRAFGSRSGVRSVGRGVLRLSRGGSRQVVFAARRGRVRYVGIADRRVLRRASTLLRYHRRAGFGARRR